MSVLKQIFLSTTTMGLLMLVFLSAIGIATFIENSDSTEAAKILVYNATWFELVLGLLLLNLVYNTFRYKMWRWAKISTLTFHLAFVVILIGSGITRFTGEEGIIKVGEQESVGYMYSAEPYLKITGLNEDGTQTSIEMQKWFSRSSPASNDFEIAFPRKSGDLLFQYAAFVPNAKDTILDTIIGSEILEFVIEGKTFYLADGAIIALKDDLYLSFNNESKTSSVQITSDMGDLFVETPFDGLYKNMEALTVEDRTNASGIIMDTIARNMQYPFKERILYNFNGVQMVLKKRHDNAQLTLLLSVRDQTHTTDLYKSCEYHYYFI